MFNALKCIELVQRKLRWRARLLLCGARNGVEASDDRCSLDRV